MGLVPLVYGTDDKKLFLDCGYRSRQGEIRVYHTFDCLLGSGRWRVGDETELGRISHFYDMELNVISAYDDVLVIAPVPDQDGVCVAIDNDTHGGISRQKKNKLVIDEKRYDITKKQLDVVSKSVRGYTF